MKKFSQKVIDVLGFYVYTLKDPRCGSVFYVGKGIGNRIFKHSNLEFDESLKVERIKEIEASGFQVKREIIHFGLTEWEALSAETTLINYLGLSNLTNKIRGKRNQSYETYSVEELENMYGADKVEVNHKVIVFKLNQEWHRQISDKELYEVTRGYWRLNMKRALGAQYVFATYKGLIKAVYKPDKWIKVTGNKDTLIEAPRVNQYDPKRLNRVYFVVEKAVREIEEIYLNKDISDYIKNTQNPVLYIN